MAPVAVGMSSLMVRSSVLDGLIGRAARVPQRF
jgi:hypothetical protein